MKHVCLLFLVCLATVATAQVDLQAGLISCYSFTGNADDGSGNDHHGTNWGATLATDRLGNANSAYRFQSGSYISIPALPLRNNNYTYSVWASANSIPGFDESDVIFSIGDVFTSWHQTVNFANSYASAGFVGINAGGYNNGFPTTTSVQSGIMPDVNRWYHIVSVRNNTDMKLYVDGVLIGTTSTNGTTPHYGTTTAANIGARCTGGQYFDGVIDDVSIYNRALSAAEVQKLFTDGLPCVAPVRPPVVQTPVFCGSGSATLRADNGATCRWYDAPSDGTLLHEGTTFQTGLLNATTHYYVSALDSDGNESARALVIVVVRPLPQPQCLMAASTYIDVSETLTINMLAGTSPFNFEIDFGDNSPTVQTTSNQIKHLYEVPGDYQISVHVTDANNCEGACTRTIEVVEPTPDLLRGLVACYSFTGNAEDRSGNNNHGTIHGPMLTKDRFGAEGRAYTYNGWDDYINIPAQPFVNNNYSYSLWAKAASLPALGVTGNIFSIGDPGSSWHQTVNFSNSYASAGFVGINVGGYNDGLPLTTSVQSGILPQIDRWYHVVSVRTDHELRMYVDGVFVSATSTNGNAPFYGFPPAANIGIRCNNTQPFHGSIDDFAIYDRPLTATEVNMLFTQTLPCPPPPVATSTRLCGPGETTIYAYGAPSYRWYDNATTTTVLHEGNTFTTPVLNASRVYYVSAYYNGMESDRVMVTVTILPLPQVQCDFADSVFVSSKTIFHANASGGLPAYTYNYNFGDNTVIEIPYDSASHQYMTPGTYVAQVTVTDANLCSAECVQEIVVLPEKVFIPNIITPDNGDVLNQLFNLYLEMGERKYVMYTGEKPFAMKIYNRWGREVYNTNSSISGWAGQGVVSGTYFYTIAFGQDAYKGWVQVVR